MIIRTWEKRVFRITGEKLTGSCVLINEKHIPTAAHLSFKLEHFYTIEGTEDRKFQAKCNFISKVLDFAILYSDDLPNLGLPIDGSCRGHKYFIMV